MLKHSLTLRAYPITEIPCKVQQAGAIIHMILNNLDPKVAQFPQELVTYGGNGQVFSNWAQVRDDNDCMGTYFNFLFISWLTKRYFYGHIVSCGLH